MRPQGPGLRVSGWGVALPDKTVTNADLATRLDTSDEWIRERTGIRERRIGDSTAALAADAARVALDRAGVPAAEIDVLVLCTTTPDQAIPATSAHVQQILGTQGGAVDLNAACSGFAYGLVVADGLLAAGAGRILLVGAETMSRVVDWEDRNTAVLFGDGAGAVVLERALTSDLLSWELGADGSTRHLLYADIGGYMVMEGRELFRQAVRLLADSASRVLAEAGLTPADVDLFIPHQANERIITAACERLELPTDRVATVLATTGNTSAASIPMALADALERGRIRSGDVVLMSGFGAGMTWASTVLRWSGATGARQEER